VIGKGPNGHANLVVITGGEPLLQNRLSDFLYALHALGYETQIESNGNFWLDIPPMTHLVISRKVNKQTRKHIKLNDDIFLRADTLKFVISTTEVGYQDVPDWAFDWLGLPSRRPRSIYVSPMNCYRTLKKPAGKKITSFWEPGLLDLEANQRNHEHAAVIAMKRNVYLTLQMHLYASLP
jgi:7-carboxy-7-deazaguanine synthase